VGPVVEIGVIAIIFIPLWQTLSTTPKTREELKPVLDYVQKNRQPDDAIYVYYGSQPAFDYYAQRYGLADNFIDGVQSRDDLAGYAHDLDQLRDSHRVWVIIAHPYGNEEAFVLQYLAGFGRHVSSFVQQSPVSPVTSRASRAAVYLFDINSG
jgi:hypothetical protein